MNDLLAGLSAEDRQFLVLASLLIAVVSFYLFVRSWKRLRIIEDTPTAKLRSAHQGYIELEGKGQFIDDHPLYSPLSNHPCLWYRSQIEQQETFISNGRSQTRWNVVYKNISHHRFKLIDGKNSCYVDPEAAEVNSHQKLVWYGNTEWPTRTQLLESQSIIHAASNSYRYCEWLILPSQPLYILGQFTTLSATAQKSIRDVMINLIKEWKQDQEQLKKRFDRDKDGQIDQEEWEVARQEAQSEAQRIHDHLALEPDMHIITKPKDSIQPFIISAYSQTMLIQKYRRSAGLALIVSLGCIAALSWLMHAGPVSA